MIVIWCSSLVYVFFFIHEIRYNSMDDDGAVKGCSTKTDDQAMYQ